jgi:hypothetical protein
LATKELAVESRQRTVSHFLCHHGIFDKNNMIVVPKSHYSPFLAPYDFTVSRHFDATEVIETESQAVLNTLTEHDFWDVFKNGRA